MPQTRARKTKPTTHSAQLRTAGRRLQKRTKVVNSSVRRYARRRNVFWGIGALAIGAVAFSLVALGTVSEVAAWELGFASEGLWLATGWLTGKTRESGTTRARALVSKATAVQCGAATADGTPCKRPGRCPHHKGGSKVASQNYTSTKNKGQWTAQGKTKVKTM